MFGSIKKFFKKSAAERQESPFAPLPTAQPPEDSTLSTGIASATIPETETVPVADGSATLPFGSIIQNVPKELHGRLAAAGLAGFTFSMGTNRILEQIGRGAVKVPFGELRLAAPAGVFVSNRDHDTQLIDLPLGEIMRQLQPEAFVRRPNQKRLEASDEIEDLFGGKGQPLAQMRVLGKNEIARSAPVASPAPPPPAKAAAPVTPMPLPAFAGFSVSNKVAPPPAPSAPVSFPKRPSAAVNSAPQVQKRKGSPPPAPLLASGPALIVSLVSIAEGWPARIRAEIAQLGLTDATCELPVAEIGAALKSGKVEYPWKQIRAWIVPPISDPNLSSHAEMRLELPLKILAPLYFEHGSKARSPKIFSSEQHIPDVFNLTEAPLPPLVPTAEPPPAATPAPAEALPDPDSSPQAAVAVDQPEFLVLPLSLVSENWPDQVRKEVELFKLADAKLEVPFAAIEAGLKQGRLNFRWKEVCQWLRPAPPSQMASANLDTRVDYRVDLPLNFVAPLFLQLRSAPNLKKSNRIGDIPDVFNAASQKPPEAAASPEPAPAVSAAPEAPSAPKPARQPATSESKKPGQDMADLFGEPGKRNWTPNDIVHKTTTLPGVTGALIALQDGLLVANCMPPTWKTETIAAFLPQIFGRMSQYTNELKMGELQSVTFSVDEGTLQIFNAGIIYFAALGRLDTPLPIAELNIIAKEISRHTR